MRKRIYLLSLMAFMAMGIYAQTLTVTGVVMAQDEPDPVIGANVMVKGTTNGTITDFDGNFSLQAKAGDVLQVSFMGYKTAEVKVSNAGPLRVTLVSDNVQLQEVVAIGYGTMKKSDLTGSVASVKAEDLAKAPVSSLDQALQGRAAGVTVTTSSGQPGQAATIRIRGIGSALGGNDPLYVVDGVITSDISFLSTQDIKSMEILKDASAAAIYGSRGANGVILITTKSGKGLEGKKPTINFDAYWGFQNRWKKLDVLNAEEHVDKMLQISTMRNGASEIAYYMDKGFQSWLKAYRLGQSEYYPTDYSFYASQKTDWQDEVFVPNAFMHNYNLSVDGGGERGHYAFSAGYFKQDGTIIGSNYERLNLRLNTDFEIRKWLVIGEHLNFSYASGRNAMNNSSSAGASVLSAAMAMAPWDPVYYPEGSTNKYNQDIAGHYSAGSNFKNVTNPYQMAYNNEPKSQTERAVGDIYLEFKPVEGLTIKPSISMDFSLNRNRTFTFPNTYTSYNYSENNYISSSMSRYMTLLEEVTATYARKIGKHNFSVMVGQTWSEYNYYTIGGSGANILNTNSNNWYLSSATTDKTETSDGVARTRRLSFLGRAFYSYDDRYMVTANFRADGSSRFTNPWGFFPSASLAWRISQEPWMRDYTFIDNLKVRAGYGQVGNDGVGDNAFAANIFSAGNVFVAYPLGTKQEMSYGAAMLTLVNTSGKWETNEQWDAGIDFGFWNGKLSGTIDYFRRNTLDALMYVNAPAQVGNRYSMVKNVGNIRNEGVEVSLNHENKVGAVHYNIGANFSYIHNEVTSVNGGSPLWGDRTKTDVGMGLNSFWGYEYEGVYATDAEALEHLYSYTAETINVHAGDAKYKDISGPDGVPDGKIDDADKKVIGNPFPKFTYGLNFSIDFYGVDFQLFFQGAGGNQIYNAQREYLEGSGTSYAIARDAADQIWVGYTDDVKARLIDKGVNYFALGLENRDGTIPNPYGASTNTANSTRFIENGDYLRLKNLQIGYTFPLKWTNKFYCNRLRVYMTASNLFTITKYRGYDPEVGGGVDYGNYPQSRTFTFGINATF